MLHKCGNTLAKAVYQGIKDNFEGVGGWIHEDYFKNPASGYEHFLNQFQQDWPEPRTEFEDQDDFESCVDDYVEEISSVLRRNNFINDFQQSF